MIHSAIGVPPMTIETTIYIYIYINIYIYIYIYYIYHNVAKPITIPFNGGSLKI